MQMRALNPQITRRMQYVNVNNHTTRASSLRSIHNDRNAFIPTLMLSTMQATRMRGPQ